MHDPIHDPVAPGIAARAAILGHTGRGDFGHGLDTAAAGLPNVSVVAVSDPDEAGRRKAQQRSGAIRAYADFQELLRQERPDLVIVAPSWLDQRVEMISAAIAAGARAIYCEKPLSRCLEEADRIVAACTHSGALLSVAHQNRVFPAPALALRLLREGRIGSLRMVRLSTKNDSRGGALEHLIHGTHLFDLLRTFAGEARWCDGRVGDHGHDAQRSDIYDGPMGAGPLCGDDIVGLYGFDHGVLAEAQSMRGDDGGGAQYLHWQLWGTGGTLTFWSDLKSPVYLSKRPYLLPTPDPDLTIIQPEIPPHLLPAQGWNALERANQALVADLLSAVREERPPLASGNDARAAVEMIQSAVAAHFAGRRLSLPLVERAHPLAGRASPG